MAQPVLSVRDLRVEFVTRRGILKAIDGISFDIGKGEVLGVVGESGAGKSVTGSAVIGLIDPPGRIAGGEILLSGMRIDNLPPEEMRKVRGKRIGVFRQRSVGITGEREAAGILDRVVQELQAGGTTVVDGIGGGVVVAIDDVAGSVVDVTVGIDEPGMAPSSPRPEAAITHTMTPTRNTNTTPITAGMLTFQRSPGPDCPPFHWSAIRRVSRTTRRDWWRGAAVSRTGRRSRRRSSPAGCRNRGRPG